MKNSNRAKKKEVKKIARKTMRARGLVLKLGKWNDNHNHSTFWIDEKTDEEDSYGRIRRRIDYLGTIAFFYEKNKVVIYHKIPWSQDTPVREIKNRLTREGYKTKIKNLFSHIQ